MADLQKNILRTSIEKGSISIAEYSRVLGVSIPTVTKVIADMIEQGLIQDEGKVDTKGGRRPNVYGLNPLAGYFVGVDIARHHFHIAICDFKGEVIRFVQDIEFVLEANADSFKRVCRRIKDEVAATGIAWDSVRACGVSLTGRVNPEKGYSLTYFVNDELPIKDQFEQQLGVPVNIENDSRAMAFGEYMNLGAKADPNMIFVNVGWGLGMGLILDGKLYYGKSGFSGEIGHFPYLNNDVICRCGKTGCLETGASGWALHKIILQKISNRTFLLISVIMMALSMAGMFVGTDKMVLYAAIALVGYGNSNIFSMCFANAMQAVPEKQNEVSGLMIMGLFGGTLFPLAMGVASDAMGQAGAVLCMAVGVAYLFCYIPKLSR